MRTELGKLKKSAMRILSVTKCVCHTFAVGYIYMFDEVYLHKNSVTDNTDIHTASGLHAVLLFHFTDE